VKIKSIKIENYKSLKSIIFEPGPLTAVIGANASGKTNLSSAFDFIGDVYSNGIEIAVAKKGGFENIAFRKLRRTKSAISFDVLFSFSRREFARLARTNYILRDHRSTSEEIKIRHKFSIKAQKQSIASDYYIDSETIELYDKKSETPLLQICRNEGSTIQINSYNDKISTRANDIFKLSKQILTESTESSNELLFEVYFRGLKGLLGNISSFQFSPQICRSPGTPSNNPKLSAYGQNLPTVVNWLKKQHQKKWTEILSIMRTLVPNLEDIAVDYLHTKTLGLFFKEHGSSRPWASEDISDGTIQTLAILCSLAGKNGGTSFIDEPENSIHPHITRMLFSHLKEISKDNQIIVSTHSPIILNLIDPNDVWIAYKPDSATNLSRLRDLSPEAIDYWEDGELRLFEILDMGIIPHAIPGGL